LAVSSHEGPAMPFSTASTPFFGKNLGLDRQSLKPFHQAMCPPHQSWSPRRPTHSDRWGTPPTRTGCFEGFKSGVRPRDCLGHGYRDPEVCVVKPFSLSALCLPCQQYERVTSPYRWSISHPECTHQPNTMITRPASNERN
jgi:hypothetical protein